MSNSKDPSGNKEVKQEGKNVHNGGDKRICHHRRIETEPVSYTHLAYGLVLVERIDDERNVLAHIHIGVPFLPDQLLRVICKVGREAL